MNEIYFISNFFLQLIIIPLHSIYLFKLRQIRGVYYLQIYLDLFHTSFSISKCIGETTRTNGKRRSEKELQKQRHTDIRNIQSRLFVLTSNK